MEKYISMLVKETDRSLLVTELSISFITKSVVFQEAGNDGIPNSTGYWF